MNPTEYKIIDSGLFEKLEKIGPYTIKRPSPQAIWPKSLPDETWKTIDAHYIRKTKGEGQWIIHNQKLPREWIINYLNLKIKVKLTGFGHLGFFAEQQQNIQRICNIIKESPFRPKILNLFAYTGISSLKYAEHGAEVTHLDAAKGVVEWGRLNQRLSKLDHKPIRWIVDDVQKYVSRLVKKKEKFDLIILDPPSFGRGPKKEIWTIEEHLIQLLLMLKKLMSNKFIAFVLSSHSQGYTPQSLSNLLMNILGEGDFFKEEMFIPQEHSNIKLTSGAICSWKQK